MQAYSDLLTERLQQRQQMQAADRVRLGGSNGQAADSDSEDDDTQEPVAAPKAKREKQQREAASHAPAEVGCCFQPALPTVSLPMPRSRGTCIVVF